MNPEKFAHLTVEIWRLYEGTESLRLHSPIGSKFSHEQFAQLSLSERAAANAYLASRHTLIQQCSALARALTEVQSNG